MPEVSIILPAFNSERYIKETLNSVITQTFEDFEIIVVDDGSTDNTRNIIREFSDYRIKYIYQNNSGSSVAKNRALRLSTGNYIAFIDHDDIWMPNKLEKQIAMLRMNSKIGLVLCNVNIINENGQIINRRVYYGKFKTDALKEMLLSCIIISPSTIVTKKECFNKVGLYDEELWYSDWELYIRILKAYEIGVVNDYLLNYRVSSSQLSKNIKKANLYRMKTLNKIWSDKELTIKYPEIMKEVYYKNNFDLGVDNYKINNLRNSRKHLLVALRYKLISYEVWAYLMKTILNPKLVVLLQRIKQLLNKATCLCHWNILSSCTNDMLYYFRLRSKK